MKFKDLPRDLEYEILSKVPATSLSQLRFTCKRWYALFKDPRFIKKMGKAATQVIIKKDYSVQFVSINPHGGINTFDPSIELTGKLKSLEKSKGIKIVSRIFHCDGLLLCTTKFKNNKLEEFVVCNPCTGQTRWIQYGGGHNAYVLGYDKFRDSYKILCFSYCYYKWDERKFAVELYEFHTDSWKVLLDDVIPFFKSNGVNLKGNTYWFASDVQYPRLVKFMLRFDFTRERFERLSLPFQSDLVQDNVVLSVVREEKLALLLQNSDVMKIWITNTKIDDEAKDLSWSIFVNFRKFGIRMGWVGSFLVDEENKMVVCCDSDSFDKEANIIYFVGEDICEKVYKNSFPMMTPLVTYTPSLVQFQSSNLKVGKRKRARRHLLNVRRKKL